MKFRPLDYTGSARSGILRYFFYFNCHCKRLFRFVALFTSNQLLELMAQIMGAFQERFNKAPPRKAILLDWERRAFGFGSVKDRPRSGRKKTLEETCAGVSASIEQSPIKFDTLHESLR
ncbi:hypothetical protein C0J52_27461 [Blattella germanica]|nr:hypothetical protein C0J52_27461 [Blattella germanica]